MRIYHYKVIAYEKEDEITHQITGFANVTINHALDEDNAIEQAKKLINRPFYKLQEIWECHTCASEDSDKAQKELQKETLKFMKKHNKEDDDEE